MGINKTLKADVMGIISSTENKERVANSIGYLFSVNDKGNCVVAGSFIDDMKYLSKSLWDYFYNFKTRKFSKL